MTKGALFAGTRLGPISRIASRPRRGPIAGPLPALSRIRRENIIETALADSKGKVAGPERCDSETRNSRPTLDWKIKQLRIKKHKFISEQ